MSSPWKWPQKRPQQWPRSADEAASRVAPHLGVTARQLEALGAGDDCFALACGSRVVRVARRSAGRVALDREACVLAAIAPGLAANVPRPEAWRPDGGPRFNVHERVQGDVITQDAWRTAVARGDHQLSALVASFLRSLHSAPIAGVSNCPLVRRSLSMEATRLRHRGVEVLQDKLPRDARAHLRMLLAEASERTPAECCLVHGDVATGHLLAIPVDARPTALGVIDFGDVCLAEPARDFVFLYEDFGSMVLLDVVDDYLAGEEEVGDEAGARAIPRDGAERIGAQEERERFLQDIRGWYLVEALDWTLDGLVIGDEERVDEGVSALSNDLMRSRWPLL